ncbi:hypothetical protein AUJ83_01995 [Candidatus Woesearchaeota archaeon CG1_02_33_12]|nr:MAG: hypothetical protein AUJ83_01995 [Candidatus Woesearchaeota archaeon CG1_02_33_12]
MVSEEEKSEIKGKVAEGKILTRVIIEIIGKPKEHIEKALKIVVDKIKEQKDIKVVEEKLFDAEKQEEMFSTFAELGVLFMDIETLVGFCFDFMPSSVEILDPEKLNFNSNEFAGLINDLLAKLHQMTLKVVQNNIEKKSLKKNMLNMLKNTVMILLSIKSMQLEQISKSSGINEKDLKPLLDSMVKENIINFKEGLYSLKK